MKEFEDYPSIKKLEKLHRRGRITIRTFENYVQSIRQFCEALEFETPKEALEYLEGIEDRGEYFDSLIEKLTEKEVSRTQIYNIFKGVKWWLKLNGLDVDWDKVILPSIESKVEDRPPTKRELQKILNVCNLRNRALVLVASSSGLRRNCLVTLKVKDVDLSSYPDVGKITVKRQFRINGKLHRSGRKISKARDYFVTFITPEAKETLQEYLEYRERKGEKVTPDSPLFTSIMKKGYGKFLSKEYIDTLWGRLLKRSGLDMRSGSWHVLHFHTLRKYTETKLINAGCKKSFREFWLGHKGGYLEAEYFKPIEEDHIREYRKAIPQLSVFETKMITKEEIRKEIADTLPDALLKPLAEKHGMDVEIYRKMLRKEKEVIETENRNEGENSNQNEDCQKIVKESELEQWLAKGFRVKAVLPSGKIVVDNEA